MTDPKTPSKREVVEEFRVSAIRDAALRVIAQKGLHGATMQAIAREAGVAKGTLYLYFESREDLVERTAQHLFSRLIDGLEATVEDTGGLEARVRSFVRAVLGFFDANRELFRLYLALCHPQGASVKSRQASPRYAAYVERVVRLLEDAMRRGEARRAEARPVAQFLAEGLNAVILRRLTDDTASDLEEEVDWIVETVLYGIAAPGAAR